MSALIRGEWIECGHVAVRTRSVLTAAEVGARVKVLGGHGYRTVKGRRVEWYGLGYFRHLLEQQSGARR